MKFRWGKGWGSSSKFGENLNNITYSVDYDVINSNIFLGGKFTQYGTKNNQKITKIDYNNGAWQNNFITNSLNNGLLGGDVLKVLTDSNGSVYFGGSFSSFRNNNNPATTKVGLVKLTPTGSIDVGFNVGVGFDAISNTTKVEDIKKQSWDNSIIVCGNFYKYKNVVLPFNRHNIARLDSTGTIDSTFQPPSFATNEIKKLEIDQDSSSTHYQKIYLTKYAETFGNRKVVRLNSDGTLDNTFQTPFDNTYSPYVSAISLDGNGKILIGLTGTMTIGGTSYNGVLRLNDDGSLDTSFTVGNLGGSGSISIKSIYVNVDGSILVGGYFTTYNGINRSGIVRLFGDGTLDGTFDAGTISPSGPAVVYDIKVTPDYRILIVGSFSTVNLGVSNMRLLNSDGTIYTAFNFSVVNPLPLTTWRPVARGYNVYVEQVFNDFNKSELIILTRGVDPYTTKQTIEYDISRLFNANDGTYKVKGEYYLNIPIQKNSTNLTDTWSIPGVNQATWRQDHRTPVSHDIEFNTDPRLYHSTFNSFNIPSAKWSAFTNNSVKYYTSTDKSRVNHIAFPNDQFNIGSFSNNGFYCPVSYLGTAGSSTLGFSWTMGDPDTIIDPLDPLYVNNVTYDQGRIEGISFIGSNIIPGEMIDILNPNNFARVYAPSYHLENTQDVQMLNRQRLVLRSDRLPVSSNPTVVGNTSLPLFLNDTFYIASITSTGDVEELNVTINQDISNANTQDFSGDTQSAVSDAIINSLSCEGLTLLSCYSGTGADFGVVKPCPANQDSSLTTQRVIGGCYYFVQAPYATATSINNDITNFTEWRARFTLVFAACRGVIGHVFQNNWVNGTLYSFGFKKKNIFDSQGNLKKYSYCGSVDGLVNPIRQYQGPIYFDDTKNTFLYRSTPYEYQTNQFIGQKPRYREFFGLGSWINANYDGLNKRNIYYPTTLMDLGPRDEFAKEICFNPQLDGYLVETLQSTSFNDTSDVLLFFILSRLLNSDLGNLLTAGNRQLNALFSRSEDRLDGDATQLFSINSEYGIVPFNDDNYNDDDVFLFSAVNSEGVSGPTIGLYFSSNTQNRILLTPGIQTYGTVLQNNGYPKTQVVPMYKWKYDTTSNMFGSELNDWDTDLENGGFYQTPYQKMKLDTTDYFQPQNGTGPFNGATGYIINYDSNGNFNQNILEFPPNQSSNFIVGAPYHFYFGLGKGKTAINRYITKYIIG
jgi:uncharacterized delta-60 repeat protein